MTHNHYLTLSVFAALLFASSGAMAQVKAVETTISIPTYLVADPEPDPYFFTGRTYQGAAGHVYPYPMYNNLTDERVDRDYKWLSLENEYTSIGVLPEIGGRIFSAQDIQTGYNFFYRQHVIRPALIGMLGSWISGGVEWNIPHHHRASSTLNAGYEVVENPDGSKTIWIGETELRQRLKWNIGLTIYPGKSYVEAKFRIENRTPLMQSFLYWANVSVHCDENYQVQFPQNTAYGTTHSKTQYTNWPYARTNEAGEPIDDSWWASFAASNSTFAVNYTDDYLVGYDFGRNAGTAHYANHHLVPGKKFFLWGTESVWNEMLTEEDGAYLELMVGAFSDNQPDYSWIGPGEIRESTQYWFPIKGIGGARNVTLDGAVNLVREGDRITVGFNSTSAQPGAKVLVKASGNVVTEKTIDIDPNTPYLESFTVPSSIPDEDIFVALYGSDGRELVSYVPTPAPKTEKPHPADRPMAPSEYGTVEELLLAAQRLEEFHNARVDPTPYYEEILRRDPLNSRANVNLGIRCARSARWEEAETYLHNAYMRLTGLHYMPELDKTGVIYHTNPKDGEMFYYLGVVSMQLGKYDEAEACFWKSTWYPGFQAASYLYLAQLYLHKGDTAKALAAADNSISLGTKSTLPRFVKASILAREGNVADAKALLRENVALDRLDFLSRIELARLDGDKAALDDIMRHMGIPLQEVLEVTTYYGAVGAYAEAVGLLDYVMANCPEYASTPMQKNAVEPFTASPLLNYMAGYFSHLAGDADAALAYYKKAAAMPTEYCFPFRYEELRMLEDVIALNPGDAKAYYYLGNLLYYYDRKEEAMLAWESSADISADNAMVFRNLGFSVDQTLGDKAKAAGYYRKAIAVDNTNPKFFYELDVLEEALKVPAKQRLAWMEKNSKAILRSDDACGRLVYLYVDNGEYKKALDLLETRHFRVWEGGQTVYTQFVDAHLLRGLQRLSANRNSAALEDFIAAGTFPRNLETNELSTGPTVAKVAFHQGLAYEASGRHDEAAQAFRKCIEAAGDGERSHADESSYYVALSYRMLGNESACQETLAAMQAEVDGQLERSGSGQVVDIYSKFGEDGDSDAVNARILYLQGLIHMAEGENQAARDCFSASLERNPSNVWAKYYSNTK